MAKKNLVFAGTPEFAAVVLDALIKNQDALDVDIKAVYTQPDKKSGRGQKMTPSVVKTLALAHGITVEQPFNFKDDVSYETLKSYAPDVLVVVAYGMILPQRVLNITPYAINVHASILPNWRGAAPIERAILAGDSHAGISIMQMVRALDAGDVLAVNQMPITNESADDLRQKLSVMGADLLCKVLKDLPYYAKNATPQNHARATYAHKISTTEGRINWADDALTITRQVRALPAFGFLGDDRVKVLQVEMAGDMPFDLPKHSQGGQIIFVNEDGVWVQVGDGVLLLKTLQWAGKTALTGKALKQRARDLMGLCFT